MIRSFDEMMMMTCCEENVQGEKVVLGVVQATSTAGRREAWKSSNGCRPCIGSQEGSTQAKRARHPAPIASSASSGESNKENEESQKNDDYDAGDGHDVHDDDNDDDEQLVVLKNDDDDQLTEETIIMGANLSRHNGKGLNGRRAQSSGSLCNPEGISVTKFLQPCPKHHKELYKFCGSLPNHLDGKDALDDETTENNNIITDTISGNLGGTLPHKKRLSEHFTGESTNNTDLAKHRSEESFDDDNPWKYRLEGADLEKNRQAELLRKKRGSDASSHSCQHHHFYERRRNSSTLSHRRAHRSAELDVNGTLPKTKRQDSTKRSAPSLRELGDGPTRASRISIDKIDDDLLLKMVHKSGCEHAKRQHQHQHQHQHKRGHPHQGKCIDLKLHKLTTGGEPQDQGYASERSPEDEHPPSLPGQPFPVVTPESTFRVTLQKSSRGLGLSVSGGATAGPVRVKRLFPQQPAALSNKLQPGDILLAANGTPLTGLTNYEALEVLRTTSNTVELVVCRLPGESGASSPPAAAPPPPPTRRDNNPGLTLKIPLNPLPPLDVEPCGEFDIEMEKVQGSLGFTLRKADSSALGHYVRSLVREPALSDGRIQPGDKIVAVDDAPLSPMSHEEAVALLRNCGPVVKLRLYRDLAQTPVSALSPTEADHPFRPGKTCLRQEAVDMLCDLAVRKLSPGTSSGSSGQRQSSEGSSNSPRRLRRPRSSNTDGDEDAVGVNGSSSGRATTNSANRNSRASTLSQETSDSDQCSIKTQITNSQPETPMGATSGGAESSTDAEAAAQQQLIYDNCDSSDSSLVIPLPPRLSLIHRPDYLELRHEHQQRFRFSVDDSGSDSGPVIVTDSDCASNYTAQDYHDQALLSSDNDAPDLGGNGEPQSMPPLLSSAASSTSTAFSYKNPAYQSAHPAYGLASTSQAAGHAMHVDHQQQAAHHATKAKGNAYSSEHDIPGKVVGGDDPLGSKGLLKWKGVMFAPNDDEVDGRTDKLQNERDAREAAALRRFHEQGYEVFMVELTRGWNSRLGFSLKSDGKNTVISVVHPTSVAYKDGRLRQGDILLMVNEESVQHMSTPDIIALMRKMRGSVGITVLRKKPDDEDS
uniref:PDZ domain-containing protein n=1 Tax=Trichogramma kaykai TaxID=54128 RepID=A0ABD2WI53_9HYME